MRILILIFAIAIATARTAVAQTPGPRYAAIVDSAVVAGVPGIQVVILDHSAEWAYAAGLSRVEARTPMRLTDRMRVASITKMVTYATIMELAAARKLQVGDRAIDRLPPATLTGIPFGDSITIDQLLQHTSGIHNFNGDRGADFFRALYGDPRRGDRRWSAIELLSFARRPANEPTGRPGAARSYSSTGYILLEMIAEHATGSALGALYRELIFDRLGMLRTGVEGYDLDARDIADSYGVRDSTTADPSPFTGRRPIRADGLTNLSAGMSYYNAWARGAGAVATTACDLGRLMRDVRDSRLTVIADQKNEFTRASARPTATFGWNGGSAGIQATILYAPAQEIIIIAITNGTGTMPGSNDVARRLLEHARERAARSLEPALNACPL